VESASALAAVSAVAVLGAAVEAFAFDGIGETSDASFANSASDDDPAVAASSAVMNLHLLAWN